MAARRTKRRHTSASGCPWRTGNLVLSSSFPLPASRFRFQLPELTRVHFTARSGEARHSLSLGLIARQATAGASRFPSLPASTSPRAPARPAIACRSGSPRDKRRRALPAARCPLPASSFPSLRASTSPRAQAKARHSLSPGLIATSDGGRFQLSGRAKALRYGRQASGAIGRRGSRATRSGRRETSGPDTGRPAVEARRARWHPEPPTRR